jgi:hypothetical protein
MSAHPAQLPLLKRLSPGRWTAVVWGGAGDRGEPQSDAADQGEADAEAVRAMCRADPRAERQ